MKKTSKLSVAVFKTVRFLVRVFYGKIDVVGLEQIPKENAVIVGNHTQMNGPIIGELFMPDNCYIWCTGQMMNRKEVPQYAFEGFWANKPKWTRPFFKLLSHMIAPLAACLFSNARTIAVYRDMRVMGTFKESVKMLKDGKNILIFPESEKKRNNIIYEFNENFVDVARLYYKKKGIELTFVPMYIAPKLRKAYIGKGIQFDSTNDVSRERKRILEYLSDEITDIARQLPLHTVIPFMNIPKKHYLTNKDVTQIPK